MHGRGPQNLRESSFSRTVTRAEAWCPWHRLQSSSDSPGCCWKTLVTGSHPWKHKKKKHQCSNVHQLLVAPKADHTIHGYSGFDTPLVLLFCLAQGEEGQDSDGIPPTWGLHHLQSPQVSEPNFRRSHREQHMWAWQLCPKPERGKALPNSL